MAAKKSFIYNPFPRVTYRDYSLLKNTNWKSIDAKIEKELGVEGLAIPSVRMGLVWILDYLGYKRMQNHILVPKFLSRCILNAINRYAFPVENFTPQTTMVLAVDQFGFRQDMETVRKEVFSKKLICIEDNANSLNSKEQPWAGSYTRLVGLSKLLPILKGGLLLSFDEKLLGFIRKRREEKRGNLYSWFIFSALALSRRKLEKIEQFAFSELAYEAYFYSPSDNVLILNNFWSGLDKIKMYTEETKKRIELIKNLLGERVFYPKTDKLIHAALLFPGEKEPEISEVFRKNSFDSVLYHYDINRNIFSPDYRKVFLIPLNPTIPRKIFSDFIQELSLVKGL